MNIEQGEKNKKVNARRCDGKSFQCVLFQNPDTIELELGRIEYHY